MEKFEVFRLFDLSSHCLTQQNLQPIIALEKTHLDV